MSAAKLDDSTQRPLYGERIIEESKIICFENPNKKRIYEISINTKKNFLKLLEKVIFIKRSKHLGKFCEIQNQ